MDNRGQTPVFFEIEEGNTVTLIAFRHQREEDYH